MKRRRDKKHAKKYCDVPKCHGPRQVLFCKRGITTPAIRVCNLCYDKHNTHIGKWFSIWEKVKLPPHSKIIIREGHSSSAFGSSSSTPPPEKGRSRMESRRSLQLQLQDLDCEHPYSGVRWDAVYQTTRCMLCGKRVKRDKNKRQEYKTKKKQKGKPNLESIKGVSLQMAMMMFFFQKGILDTTWKDAIDIARAVHPGTKFSNATFSWYRNYFTKRYITKKGSTHMERGDKKKHSKKSKKVVKKATKKGAEKKGKKRVTIIQTVFDYFDKVGVDKAKFAAVKKRVLRVKPDSAFNEQHLSYYRQKYREAQQ